MNTRLIILALLALASCKISPAAPKAPPARPKASIVPTPTPTLVMPVFEQNNHILFQGDSITDGNRGRSDDPNHILGHGYVFIIAAKYGAQLAERNLTFINRGISGNKVSDLAGRWKGDTLDLKPDILSILVGVNDASANVPIDQYEKTYDQILQQAVTSNPRVRLVLCEPFTLPGDKHKDDWHTWRANIQSRQDAVARLAVKYQAAVVDFQKVLEAACKRAPASYWVWDTVHPTYSGHQLLADEWVRTVGQFQFKEHPQSLLAPDANANAANPGAPVTNFVPLNAPPQKQGAFSFASAHGSDNTKTIVLGWSFTNGPKALSVTSLGYLNDGATGNLAKHTIGIYDSQTKTLVAPAVSVTTTGGNLRGTNATFSYLALPHPIRLEAGKTYVVAATTTGTGWLEAPQGFLTDYGIIEGSLHCAFKFGSEELAFPDSTYAANDPALLGPNFLASVVP